MKDKYLLETIKEEKLLDKFKEYKEMSREEIEYQLSWGDTNEFSWGFAIYLLNLIDKATEYIENIEEDKDIDGLFVKKKEKSFLNFLKIKKDLLKIFKGGE